MQNNIKISQLVLDGSVQDVVVPDGVGGVTFVGSAGWSLYDGDGNFISFGAGVPVSKKGQLCGEIFKVKGGGTLHIIFSMGLVYGNPVRVGFGGTGSSGGGGAVYHDGVVSGQLTLSGVAQQLTSIAKPGYLQVRCTGDGYVGGVGVTTGNGVVINDDNGYLTLSYDDISKVYAVGSGSLSFCGGYIS